MKPGRFISLYILFSAVWLLIIFMWHFRENDPRNNSIILFMMLFFWLMYTALLGLVEIIYIAVGKSFKGFLWIPLVIQAVSFALLGKNELIIQGGYTAAFVIAWFSSRETTPSSPQQ